MKLERGTDIQLLPCALSPEALEITFKAPPLGAWGPFLGTETHAS